jgi:hypothetical protein
MNEISDARLTAQSMLRIYGGDAVSEAAKRIAAAKAGGDLDAIALWEQIAKAIVDLDGKLPNVS